MWRILATGWWLSVTSLVGAVERPDYFVDLANGDRLTGRFVSSSNEELVLEHPLLGRLSLARVDIRADGPLAPVSGEPEAPAATPPPGTATAAPPQAVADDAASGWFADWDRRISAGFSAARGSASSTEASVALRLARENAQQRSLLESAFLFARADGETAKNEYFAAASQDWLMAQSPWFLFAKGRYDFDDFTAWDHRLQAAGGVGRELVQGETFELRARLGAGATRTIGGEDNLVPEGFAELESDWQLTDTQHLHASTELVPDLSEFGEYRWISEAAWTVELTGSGQLGLEVGTRNDYDSDPPADDPHNELTYYGRIGYDF